MFPSEILRKSDERGRAFYCSLVLLSQRYVAAVVPCGLVQEIRGVAVKTKLTVACLDLEEINKILRLHELLVCYDPACPDSI